MSDSGRDDLDPRLLEDITPGTWKVMCPFCGAKLPGDSRVCSECGREFAPDEWIAKPPGPNEKGGVYSWWAELALIIGQFVSILGCVIAVLAAIICLVRFEIVALFLAVLSFFYSLGLYVVFTRVQGLGKKRS
jgi:hypothetical protein